MKKSLIAFILLFYSPTKRDKVGVCEQYAEWYWSLWLNPSKTQQFFIN